MNFNGRENPYQTTHCRVPVPVKTIVDALSGFYRKNMRRYPADVVTLQITVTVNTATGRIESSFNEVEGGLVNGTIPNSEETKLDSLKELVHLYRQRQSGTRNWVEAKRLLDAIESLKL